MDSELVEQQNLLDVTLAKFSEEMSALYRRLRNTSQCPFRYLGSISNQDHWIEKDVIHGTKLIVKVKCFCNFI